jgi:hypothetical protein
MAAGIAPSNSPGSGAASMSRPPALPPAQLRRSLLLGLAAWPLLPAQAAATPFDPSHAAWDALLARRVGWTADGHTSRVDYRGFATEREALREYLAQLSALDAAVYAGWTRSERLAFLINAYNAYTIELVLDAYPKLASIRDLGSWLRSPWERPFFQLLGRHCSLDTVEHGMIRAPGAFDDPRIHFAVVCASIGCPALRPEALTGAKLDGQLDDSMGRFLADRSRNRYDPAARALQVSRLFDWYRGDFEKGFRGLARIEDVFARHADALADAPADRQAIRERRVPVRFLNYDWRLNDLPRS